MDFVFVGPIIGGALALAGTLHLEFSPNKRQSIAAVERQLAAWHAIALGAEQRGIETHWERFISQGPFLHSDPDAWHLRRTLTESILGRAHLDDGEFQKRLGQLNQIATQRIDGFSLVVEDIKRRSAWASGE